MIDKTLLEKAFVYQMDYYSLIIAYCMFFAPIAPVWFLLTVIPWLKFICSTFT